MEIVGLNCNICKKKITSLLEGTACDLCKICFHKKCLNKANECPSCKNAVSENYVQHKSNELIAKEKISTALVITLFFVFLDMILLLVFLYYGFNKYLVGELDNSIVIILLLIFSIIFMLFLITSAYGILLRKRYGYRLCLIFWILWGVLSSTGLFAHLSGQGAEIYSNAGEEIGGMFSAIMRPFLCLLMVYIIKTSIKVKNYFQI